MYGALDTSTSALVAYRTQMDVIAGNIAMKDSYQQRNGEFFPYRRRVALFSPGDPAHGPGARGVHVAKIMEDPAPFMLRDDPGSAFAIKQGPNRGKVRVSNFDYHTEMVNAITAARAYEANITVAEMVKSVAAGTLRLIA